jgi:putative FmdB family regulatory protein
MPYYEYRCPECGYQYDDLAPMDSVAPNCPSTEHELSCFADAVTIGPAGIKAIEAVGGDPTIRPQPCTCKRQYGPCNTPMRRVPGAVSVNVRGGTPTFYRGRAHK